MCHDPFDLNVDNPTNELIARTDSPELSTTLRKRQSLFRKVKMFVQFAFRNPVVSTLCFDSPEFSRVDPPLESGITDAEHFCSVTKSY